MNRFAWDFRGENIQPDISGVYVNGDYKSYRLAPGTYKAAVLSFKGNSTETNFTVLSDPNLSVTQNDWDAQQAFLQKLAVNISDIHTHFNKTNQLKKQIEHYNSLLKEDNKALIDAGKGLIKKTPTGKTMWWKPGRKTARM